MGAGEVHLPDACHVEFAAASQQRGRRSAAIDLQRHAARLQCQVGEQAQQFRCFRRQLGRTLLTRHAGIDPGIERADPAEPRIPGRQARREAAHRARRIAVAIGAGLRRGAAPFPPQRFAPCHREHGRIREIILLHAPHVLALEFKARARLRHLHLGLRLCLQRAAGQQQDQ